MSTDKPGAAQGPDADDPRRPWILPADPEIAPPRPPRRIGATASSQRPAGRGDVFGLVVRGLGQTLVTLGVIVLLFVVYEVYVTDLFGAAKQRAATAAVDQRWATAEASETAAASKTAETTQRTVRSTVATVNGTAVVVKADPDTLVTDPRKRQVTYKTFDGQGFAKIYIPTFGADYVFTVIEGTSQNDLYEGPGHYADTQLPGQPGNFAVAGHRVSKGSPFNYMANINSCDAVVIETQDDWFVYRVLPMAEQDAGWTSASHPHCAGIAPLTGQYQGVFGREITDPGDYPQVLPVPHVNSNEVPADALRLITLTTCHPQFSDRQRMIIHGLLVKSYAKSTGFCPELSET